MNAVALITGASRGIGRGIALDLARRGLDLVINYVANKTAAAETSAACVDAARTTGKIIRVEACPADISREEDRSRLVEFTKARFGRIDMLVNNAGVAPDVRADILEASEASFDRMIRINVKGPYFLTQLVAKTMIEQLKSTAAKAPIQPKIV